LIEFSQGRSIKLPRSLSSRALIASMIVTFELPIEIETIRMFLWKMPGVPSDEWTASMKQTPLQSGPALSKALRREVVPILLAVGVEHDDGRYCPIGLARDGGTLGQAEPSQVRWIIFAAAEVGHHLASSE
jgi:hypothetical protein